MEWVIHNDYRQEPITSDEDRQHYRRYLGQLEAMIAEQEDAVLRARSAGDEDQLGIARTSFWRLLTKRQGVVDAIMAYERRGATDHGPLQARAPETGTTAGTAAASTTMQPTAPQE